MDNELPFDISAIHKHIVVCGLYAR